MEIAAYVYAADQASERGSASQFDYGLKWRRRFRFVVPVREPDVRNHSRVAEELVRTLSFLSDDYEFAFTRQRNPTQWPEYLAYDPGVKPVTDVQEVMLFSGGLDSLAGAVDEVLTRGRKVALVSHRPVTKIDSRQLKLVDELGSRANPRALAPFHVRIVANKAESLGKDFTQRTRSFLFASSAAVIARMFGLDRVRFYENGVASCNLPICAQVRGGRASRTTDPQVLGGFERLFGLLFGRSFTVENPFFWKTRTDVIDGLRAAGQADLAAHSVSCAHTWQASRDQPHCGTCSQCVDRRLAALAAGLKDAEDPPRRHRVQLLTDRLDDVLEQTMVERIVGTARDVVRPGGPLAFVQRFGEASRLLRQLPGRTDEVAVRLFEMHRRHARQICDVLDRELAARGRSGEWGTLAPTCLLKVLAGDEERDTFAHVNDPADEPAEQAA